MLAAFGLVLVLPPHRSPGIRALAHRTLVGSHQGRGKPLPTSPWRSSARRGLVSSHRGGGKRGSYWWAMSARPPRRTYFWILPVAVLGSSSTKWNPWGVLKWARLAR